MATIPGKGSSKSIPTGGRFLSRLKKKLNPDYRKTTSLSQISSNLSGTIKAQDEIVTQDEPLTYLVEQSTIIADNDQPQVRSELPDTVLAADPESTLPVTNPETVASDNPVDKKQEFSRKPPATSIISPISELWNQAYDDLRIKEKKLVKEYEATILINLKDEDRSREDVKREDQMRKILQRKIEEVNQNMWKLKFGAKEVPVKDLMQPVVGIVDWANDYITAAVSANPYASIAWAGVGLLLPLFLNPSKQAASLTTGLEYISGLIVQSSMRENLYSRRFESKNGACDRDDFSASHGGYRDALKEVYIRILKFQAKSVCYYSENAVVRVGSDMVKSDNWDSLLEDVKKQEKAFCCISDIWKDVVYEEECINIGKRHQESLARLIAINSGLHDLQNAIKAVQEDSQRKELLSWLSSIDPSENYNSARERHEAETGDWLVKGNEGFKRWETVPNSLLWLHGKAGCGKSVLSSSVIKYLRDSYSFNPQTALGFFYFSFSDVTKQNTVGMLRSLIKQLCCRRPDTPRPLKDLARYKEQGQNPDMNTVEETLLATIHGFSTVFLVIDALDECPSDNGERDKLLGCLNRIHMAKSENLHLLCTSRRVTDIEDALDPLLSPPESAINLSSYKKAVDDDIGLYIDNTFASLKYKSWPADMKTKARVILIEKADGMFQFVSCQFEELQKLSRLSLVQKALNDLPKGLDATYDRMLQSVNPNDQKIVASLLKWLAFSVRPLRLDELAEISILDHENDSLFIEDDRLFDPEDVLKYLPGLVTKIPIRVEPHGSDWHNTEVFEIRLTHFSIKEYLISQRIRHSLAADFSINEIDAHVHISESCLAYHLHISKAELATQESLSRFALWEYAATHWVQHVEMVSRDSWTESIKSWVRQILTPRAQSLVNVIRRKDPDNNMGQNWDKSQDNLASPLYYMASLGALQLTWFLIERGANVNEHSPAWKYGNALQAAVCKGQESVVQLFLKKGADINIQGGPFGNALQAAVYEGKESVVQLLLNKGADINARGGPFGNALQAAVYEGNESVVQLLLDNGADINAQGEKYGNALQAAVYEGNESVVQLLLDNGADINGQGGTYGNALQAAAFRRSGSLVQLLLDKGADINAQGGMYGNALQAAVYYGRKGMVKHLLDNGADVNAQGGEYGNALQAAAFNGSKSIVQLLLGNGADINAQGGKFGNAFQAAVREDNFEISKLLLSRGAKVDRTEPQQEELLARDVHSS